MQDLSASRDCAFSAFITNLGKYNEGYLIGEWVKFPVTNEELQAVFQRIGINQYMDRFIDNFTHWATIPISCSAGIAFIRDGAPSYQKILSLADEALYRSKQNGKNQYNYAEEKS